MLYNNLILLTQLARSFLVAHQLIGIMTVICWKFRRNFNYTFWRADFFVGTVKIQFTWGEIDEQPKWTVSHLDIILY